MTAIRLPSGTSGRSSPPWRTFVECFAYKLEIKRTSAGLSFSATETSGQKSRSSGMSLGPGVETA